MTDSDPSITFYGFTPVPRDPQVLFLGHPTAIGDSPKQDPFTIEDFTIPESPIAQAVRKFVKVNLPPDFILATR